MAPDDHRPTVAWDVDDVLNDLTEQWLKVVGLQPVKGEWFGDAEPYVLSTGISRTDYLNSLDSFRRDRYGSLAPNPLAKDWFRANGHRCQCVAVTSTPLFAAPIVAEWVMGHFGEWIRGFFVVPSPRPGDGGGLWSETKGQVVDRLGAAILVDDSPSNLGTLLPGRTTGILYPCLWNGGGEPVVALSEVTSLLR